MRFSFLLWFFRFFFWSFFNDVAFQQSFLCLQFCYLCFLLCNFGLWFQILNNLMLWLQVLVIIFKSSMLTMMFWLLLFFIVFLFSLFWFWLRSCLNSWLWLRWRSSLLLQLLTSSLWNCHYNSYSHLLWRTLCNLWGWRKTWSFNYCCCCGTSSSWKSTIWYSLELSWWAWWRYCDHLRLSLLNWSCCSNNLRYRTYDLWLLNNLWLQNHLWWHQQRLRLWHRWNRWACNYVLATLAESGKILHLICDVHWFHHKPTIFLLRLSL